MDHTKINSKSTPDNAATLKPTVLQTNTVSEPSSKENMENGIGKKCLGAISWKMRTFFIVLIWCTQVPFTPAATLTTSPGMISSFTPMKKDTSTFLQKPKQNERQDQPTTKTTPAFGLTQRYFSHFSTMMVAIVASMSTYLILTKSIEKSLKV